MTLNVANVGVRLGGHQILEQIDTTVEEGAFVGLVGPNGAGKTTLLRTINAALDPDVGSVFLDGEDVHDLGSKEASRRMATVPQKTNLSFDFTVREIVEMGRHPHRSRFSQDTDDEHVDRALSRANVDHLADRPVTEVSGGERQRVLLARALAQNSPVLLLDEPTASLDINHQVRTLDLVRELVDEGHTAVAAIHDLNLAARYCDDLVLVADGEVLAAGDPVSVLTPDNLHTAFGVRVAVATNPVTGTPTVTALSDHDWSGLDPDITKKDNDAHSGGADLAVHVLGGRDAAPLLAPLTQAGFEVSVGPVPEASQDHEAAAALGHDVITTPPFAGVPDSILDAASDSIDRADVTVIPKTALDLGANSTLLEVAEIVVVVGEMEPTSTRPGAVWVAPDAIVEGVSAAASDSVSMSADVLPHPY